MNLALMLMVVAFGLSLAIIVRVWRASTLDGILVLFFPIWTIVCLIKYWKDPDHDIRYFFFGQLLLSFGAVAIIEREAARMEREEAVAQQQAQAEGDNGHGASGVGTRLVRTADAAPAPRSSEPDTPARAPTAEEEAPPPLRLVLRNVSFLRGAMEKSSAGFKLQIPDHFHALSATDAHRIEQSLRLPLDTHEVAWIAHESIALDASEAWHVSVRWQPDGWIASGGVLDPWQLLQAGQRATASRLAGSGGDLIGYAVAPSASDGVTDWVEERLPPGAHASVLDCHAVRLGRRGVLEFTVAGQPVGTQQLCDASVRLLAHMARFEPEADYSAAPPDGAPRAAYTLVDLITGTH